MSVGLAREAAPLPACDQGLVDQDLGVGQSKALALGAAGQQECALEAAIPMQMVDTSHLIYCMVSWMAMPALIERRGC